MRILIAVLMLAVVGCGGSGSSEGDGEHKQGQDDGCVTYRPHPDSQPHVEREDCFGETWEADAFCWRTTDEPSCFDGDGSDVAIGCLFIRDGYDAPKGTQTVGCVVATDCVPGMIDNPECCGGAGLDRSEGWDCPTP